MNMESRFIAFLTAAAFYLFGEMSSIIFSPLDYVIQFVLSSKLNKPFPYSKNKTKYFAFKCPN